MVAASVLSGRLLLHALDNRRWLVAVPTCAVLLGLAWQEPAHHATAARGARSRRPTLSPPDACSITARRAGDIFIPFHTYYGALAGKRTFVIAWAFATRKWGWVGRRSGPGTAESVLLGHRARLEDTAGRIPFVDSRYHRCGRCAKAWIRAHVRGRRDFSQRIADSTREAAALRPVAVG